MTTSTLHSVRSTTVGHCEQLTLDGTAPAALRPSSAHARFRLSEQTRRRGLEHVAEIRRRLQRPEGAAPGGASVEIAA